MLFKVGPPFSMIIAIGYLHFLLQNKLIPAHWSETMTTEVGDVKIRTAKVEVPVDDAGYHYMSLVPQQIAAGAKDLAVEI